MSKKAKRKQTAKQSASKPACYIEFTERDNLIADGIMSHLCAWACKFFDMEPTAENMRTVYALAADHAKAAIEMREFTRNPAITQQ